MNKPHAKKFALIGLPGSGKSTFASKLGRTLGIPIHHLDRHMFEPDGKKKDKQEFIEKRLWRLESYYMGDFEIYLEL